MVSLRMNKQKCKSSERGDDWQNNLLLVVKRKVLMRRNIFPGWESPSHLRLEEKALQMQIATVYQAYIDTMPVMSYEYIQWE